jgi:hypothetical protein
MSGVSAGKFAAKCCKILQDFLGLAAAGGGGKASEQSPLFSLENWITSQVEVKVILKLIVCPSWCRVRTGARD